MIIVVDGVNAGQFTGLLKDVFELRARVFRDRLGWDVEVVDGQERDHFDSLHPTHIVSVNDDGKVAGAMR
jgi:N-acyl-L-homoserine lactone synthetase